MYRYKKICDNKLKLKCIFSSYFDGNGRGMTKSKRKSDLIGKLDSNIDIWVGGVVW